MRVGVRWTNVLGAAFVIGIGALAPVRSVEAQSAAMVRSGLSDVPPAAVSGIIIKYKDAAATINAGKTPTTLSLPVSSALTSARQLSLNSFAARNGLTLRAASLNTLGHLKISVSRVMSRIEAEKLARSLLDNSPEIEWAVPDVQVPLAAIPNDTYWTNQWALQSTPAGINMPGAWDLYTIRRSASDSNLPIVAIVDSGYRRHEDLALPEFGPNTYNGVQPPLDTGDSYLQGECSNDPSSSQQFNSWHGLKIHGQIAALTSNSKGMAGVDSQLKILQSRYFGKCGGSLSAYVDAIIGSVNYRSASGQRVRVLNLSQGGTSGACYAPLQEALTNAINAGVTVVASAGNSALDASVSFPGNCPGVIAVAATNPNGARTYYSNYGATIALAAPGGEYTASDPLTQLTTTAHVVDSGQVPVDDISTNYQQTQGTSFAAPHVAAVAGMMLNINPSLTPGQVRAKLIASVKPFPGSCTGCGAGLLDARAALVSVLATISQTINFPQPADQVVGVNTALVANSSSSLPVTFTTGTPSTCNMSGSTLRPLALGVCTITAMQPGDATYMAASPVTRSFQVKQTAGGGGPPAGDMHDVPTLPEWGLIFLASGLLFQITRRGARRVK